MSNNNNPYLGMSIDELQDALRGEYQRMEGNALWTNYSGNNSREINEYELSMGRIAQIEEAMARLRGNNRPAAAAAAPNNGLRMNELAQRAPTPTFGTPPRVNRGRNVPGAPSRRYRLHSYNFGAAAAAAAGNENAGVNLDPSAPPMTFAEAMNEAANNSESEYENVVNWANEEPKPLAVSRRRPRNGNNNGNERSAKEPRIGPYGGRRKHRHTKKCKCRNHKAKKQTRKVQRKRKTHRKH